MDSERDEEWRPIVWILTLLWIFLTVVETFDLFRATFGRLWPLFLVIAAGARLVMIVRGGNARDQAGALARWMFVALLGLFFATITLGLPVWSGPSADWPIYIPALVLAGGLALLTGYGASLFRRRDLLAWGLGLLFAGGLGVAGTVTGFTQKGIPWGNARGLMRDSRLDFLDVWWPAALIVVGVALIVAGALDVEGTRRKVLVAGGILLAIVGAFSQAITLGWLGGWAPPWWCLLLPVFLIFYALLDSRSRRWSRRRFPDGRDGDIWAR